MTSQGTTHDPTSDPKALATRVTLVCVEQERDLPAWADRTTLARFFHETMKPYHDSLDDVNRALDYAFVPGAGQGGFLTLAGLDGRLVGALLMLRTGMAGYVPSNILLFVSVDPSCRGAGLGGRIITESVRDLAGDVKLHVEYDNPAKRLYERLGFTTKYAEMRLKTS